MLGYLVFKLLFERWLFLISVGSDWAIPIESTIVIVQEEALNICLLPP